MITSLFKIVGLSLLSLCPFHKLADSSISYDLTVNEVEKVDIKANKKSIYNPSNDSLLIYPSDLENGYYDDIVLTSSQGQISESYSIEYQIEGQTGLTQTNCNAIQVSTSFVNFKTETTVVGGHSYYSIYLLDFGNKVMNRQSFKDNGLFTTSNVLSYRFTSQNNSVYSNFFSEVQSYIQTNTKISFASDYLNNYYYKDFTNLIVQNPNLVQYASCSYYGNDGYVEAGSNNVSFNIGDDRIYLYSDGDKPLYIFYSADLGGDSYFGGFSSTLNVYVNDFESYEQLLNAYNLRSMISNYVDYKESFTFDMVFNYNAPYLKNIDSLFIQDSYFTSDTDNTYHKYVYYSLPYFQCNGQIFNAVWVEYLNGYSTGYINGDSTAVGGVGNGYFQHLWFVNEDTNYQKLVCYRNYTEKTVNNNINTYLTTGCSWVNTEYRYINFFEDLSSDEKNSLAQFNNFNYFNGLTGGSVSLNDSFAVINTGLVGLMGFLSIQLLPGITIGTLILIPFVITLMLFIVKLFKR